MSNAVPLSLEQIQRGLQDRSLSKVATATGLSFTTLQRLLAGGEDNYQLQTLLKVSDYLREMQLEGVA